MNDYSHDIERYLKGEMTSAEQHAFEKKVLDDPFLADALEGAERNASNFSADVAGLNSRMRSGKPSRFTWTYRIAAGLALLMISSYVIWNLTQTVNEQPLSLEKSIDTNTLATPFDQDGVEVDAEIEMAESEEGPTQEPSTPVGSQALRMREEHKETVKPFKEAPSEAGAQPVAPPVQTTPMEGLAKKEPSPAIEIKPVDIASQDLAAAEKKRQAINQVSRKAEVTSFIVKGKVISSEDGSGLPGVNVVIKGSNLGTVTDSQGNYILPQPESHSILVFSFIGLTSKEVPVNGREEVNAQLSADVAQLSEVVVVGSAASTGYDANRIPSISLAHPEPGNRTFKQYLETNIQYPQEAIVNKTEGRVTVEFTVEPDSSLTDFIINRGIGSGCDEELIRLIKEGPKWVPTSKDGVPIHDKARVRLRFTLPK